MAASNKMTADFSDKPMTEKLAGNVIDLVEALGPSHRERKAQLSFGVKRKFIWMWIYGRTPDGTLYLTVTLDKELRGPHFHYVKEVSSRRWNHHVVVKSSEQIESAWFKSLLEDGYAFSSK